MKKKVTTVTPTDISELTDEALWCRTERHPWKWDRDSMADTGIEFDRIATCPLCGATRAKTISLVTFTVLRTHRTYPKGYLMHGTRLKAPQVYKEQLGRMAKSGKRAPAKKQVVVNE